MNKRTVYIMIFVSLLCSASFVLAACSCTPGQPCTEICNPLNYNNFKDLLTEGIIPTVAGIAGSLATVMIIYAGILYLTSAGNQERMGAAKKALVYAVIGIAIALVASAIALTIESIMTGPAA